MYSFNLFYRIRSEKKETFRKFIAHKYHSRREFLRDIEQILENCTLYNGKDSPFTQKAETLVKVCKETLDEVSFANSIIFSPSE